VTIVDLENKQFYAIVTGFDKGWAYGEWEKYCNFSSFDDERVDRCPLCKKMIGGKVWFPPYEISLSSKKLGDFIFGLVTYFIVSYNFKNKYEQSGLTGIKEFKKMNRLRFRREIINADYYFVIPERINVRPEPIKKGNYEEYDVDMPYCEVCSKLDGKIYSGDMDLRMNLRGFEKTPDVFLTYTDSSSVFCTQAFVNFCIDENFSNFERHFVSFENYSSIYEKAAEGW
jgi:hypothetical protein